MNDTPTPDFAAPAAPAQESAPALAEEPASPAAAPAESAAPVAVAGPPTRIVAVANQKGGVGKTTTVVNLAACLAELGRRVLVIDLDPQANATSGLGMGRQSGNSLYAALLGGGPAEASIRPSGVAGIDIIPSELDLAGCEVDVARSDHYLQRLRMALEPIRQARGYDHILIDCPPSLGILTMNALTAADSLLVPMQCEYYALEGLSVIHRLIAQLRDGGANPGLRMEGIVMTMYDARTKLGGEVVKEVNRHFADALYDTVIPRNVRLSEAPSFGKPVILYDPLSSGAAAYRRLAEEFLKRQGVELPAAKRTVRERRLPIFRITKIGRDEE